ncbi:MAG: TatD family hydrolase [Elusimicrobiaceae bacterium]|nr:TatD family hydrolase [Elusimicrobiaceae bacterium]
MPFADAHLHLLPPGITGFSQTLDRAGITRAFANSAGKAEWQNTLYAARCGPVTPFIGIHPWFCARHTPADLAELDALLARNPAARVGETGLDGAIQTAMPLQEEFFAAQAELARRHHRALSVHCVKAWAGMMKILRRTGPFPAGFIMHGFSGPAELISELTELGGYFSFGPRVLDPRGKRLPSLIKAVPAHRLLCETDFPHGRINGTVPPFPPIDQVTMAVGALAGISGPAETFYENAGRAIGFL